MVVGIAAWAENRTAEQGAKVGLLAVVAVGQRFRTIDLGSRRANAGLAIGSAAEVVGAPPSGEITTLLEVPCLDAGDEGGASEFGGSRAVRIGFALTILG